MTYLNSLGTKAIALIPLKIKQEIDLLKNVASNPEKVCQIESCLASRGSSLENAIEDQEDILSAICLKDTDKREMLINISALGKVLHSRL